LGLSTALSALLVFIRFEIGFYFGESWTIYEHNQGIVIIEIIMLLFGVIYVIREFVKRTYEMKKLV